MPNISFSGLASGIDSESLIKATLDARRLANRPLEKKIEENNRESKALEEFNTKLLTLNDSLKEFLTLAGNGIAKTGTTSDSDVLGVSIASTAPVTSTSMTIEALAKGATLSFGERFSSLDSPIAPSLSGTESLTFTVGVGADAKNIQIDVTSSTTLREIVEKLNVAGEGKLAASAVNLGSDAAPQYALVLSTSETGISKGSIALSASAGLQSLGLFASPVIDQAQDALFTIAGLGQVSRPSNKVSGIIPGVTFELKQVSAAPVQLTVSDDRERTKEKFLKVVGLINELIVHSKEKSKIERVEKGGEVENLYSELGKTRVDEQALTAIKQALSDAFAGNGSSVRSFADLGVTTERDGTLKFDAEVFVSKLAEDGLGASTVLTTFADKLASTNGVINEYTRYQGTIDLAITANASESESMQAKIDRLEQSLEKQAEALKKLFANLESRVSKLNSSADAITGMIAGSVKK